MCFEVRRRVVASPYVIFACAMGWLSPGNSQEPSRDIPSNAHYSAGEQGWGVGIHSSILDASLAAVISAANRIRG